MIFSDLDNVIADSSTAFIQAYSIKFGVKPVKLTTNCWDFSDCFPKEIITQQDKIDVFGSKLYFDLLEPIENSIEVLQELSEKHKIYIVSISSPESSKRKIDWCYYNLPFANFIPVISYEHDKSIINMQCRQGDWDKTDENNLTYHIDDMLSCLKSSNADYKILFEIPNASWQVGVTADFKAKDWNKINEIIMGRR